MTVYALGGIETTPAATWLGDADLSGAEGVDGLGMTFCGPTRR